MFVKTILAMGVTLSLFSGQAIAGTEDWEGHYIIQLGENVESVVYHSAQKVSFMFFSAGKCIHISKGAKINGFEMPNDFNICTDTNIPQFTQEVQNISSIISKEIIPGPSYHD